MLFSRHMLLQLDRNRLVAVTKKTTVSLELTTDMIHNLEVITPGKLSEAIGTFITKNALRGYKALLVLNDDVVFQKISPLTKDARPTDLKADFENKLPLAPEEKVVLALTLRDQLVLLATNRLIYEVVCSAFERGGVKVTAVVPAAAYGQARYLKATPEAAAAILRNKKVAHVANFLLKAGEP